MQEKTTLAFDTLFMKEVYEGLTAFPKHLSSKFFYDEKGDKLFQDIMAMPEYYLTNAEFDILEEHKEQITTLFAKDNTCLLYTSPSPRDRTRSRMPSSA